MRVIDALFRCCVSIPEDELASGRPFCLFLSGLLAKGERVCLIPSSFALH